MHSVTLDQVLSDREKLESGPCYDDGVPINRRYAWHSFPRFKGGANVYAADVFLDGERLRLYQDRLRTEETSQNDEEQLDDSLAVVKPAVGQTTNTQGNVQLEQPRRLQVVGTMDTLEIEYALDKVFSGEVPRFGDVTVVRREPSDGLVVVCWYCTLLQRECSASSASVMVRSAVSEMIENGPSSTMREYGFHFDIRDLSRSAFSDILYAPPELDEEEVEDILMSAFDDRWIEIPDTGHLIVKRTADLPNAGTIEWWKEGFGKGVPSLYTFPYLPEHDDDIDMEDYDDDDASDDDGWTEDELGEYGNEYGIVLDDYESDYNSDYYSDYDSDYDSDYEEGDYEAALGSSATADEIAALPARHITVTEEGDVCGICIIVKKADEVVTVLPCKHWFDKDCITMWLQRNRTCPACRAPITS